MKKYILFFSILVAAAFTACNKQQNNGDPSGVMAGNGSVNLHWLYDIKDWIKDNDPEMNYPEPVHFYSGKTNVKFIFRSGNTYTFSYVAMPSNTAINETGTWNYNENLRTLTLTPSSGNPYSYRMASLRDEHMTWGYTYTTYDAEGTPNGTAEELVYLFGEK